jgi:hypothetical protein
MPARTGLHANQARRQRLEERQQLGMAHLSAQYHLAANLFSPSLVDEAA